MRVLVFTGTGGAGTTTVAAATAVRAARCGLSTLLISTSAAPGLTDVLDRAVDATPTPVEPGLSAQLVDPRHRTARSWPDARDLLLAALEQLGTDPLTAADLTDLPGVDDVAALLEVRDQVLAGGRDLVILDCGPVAEALRLLSLPERLSRCLDRLLPLDRKVARALAGYAADVDEGAPDPLVAVVDRLRGELDRIAAALAPPRASVRLVLTPGALPLAGALRARTALALHGHAVDGVVVNRALPVPDGTVPDGTVPDGAWPAAWVAARRHEPARIAEAFDDLPVSRVPWASAEPVGSEALAGIAERAWGPAGPVAAAELTAPLSRPRAVRVDREGREFVLRLDLPGARRQETDLARLGDELAVTCGGHRRVIALPGALRRCRVVGASLREGVLGVRFEPDPDLWPASLL